MEKYWQCHMPAKKSSSMLKTIVSLAKSLGELNHRSFLLEEELKALHLQGKEDSAFLERKGTRQGVPIKRALSESTSNTSLTCNA